MLPWHAPCLIVVSSSNRTAMVARIDPGLMPDWLWWICWIASSSTGSFSTKACADSSNSRSDHDAIHRPTCFHLPLFMHRLFMHRSLDHSFNSTHSRAACTNSSIVHCPSLLRFVASLITRCCSYHRNLGITVWPWQMWTAMAVQQLCLCVCVHALQCDGISTGYMLI